MTVEPNEMWLIEWDEGGGRCEECRRNKYCSMKTKGGCGPQKRHRKKQQEEMIKQLMKQAQEAQEVKEPEVIDGEFVEVKEEPVEQSVASQPQVGNLNRI